MNSTDISRGQEPVPVPFEGLAKAELATLERTFTKYLSTCIFHDSYVKALDERYSDCLDDESIATMTAAEFGCECLVGPDAAGAGTGDQRSCSSSSEECDCVSWHGNFYTDTTADPTPILQLNAVPNRHVLYECSEMCACAGHACSNAVVRRGMRVPLTIMPVRQGRGQSTERATGSPGLGVFAAAPIRKGQFICEYAGELISPSEAQQRWARQATLGQGNYILTIRESASSSTSEGGEHEHSNGARLRDSRIDIDPRQQGNVARFINHLCPPLTNVVIVPVRCDGPLLLQTDPNGPAKSSLEPLSRYLLRLRNSFADRDGPNSVKKLIPAPPRAGIFAAREIAAGEELGFDYADPTQSEANADGAKLISGPSADTKQQQNSRTACLCGSAACRGWLPFDEQTSSRSIY